MPLAATPDFVGRETELRTIARFFAEQEDGLKVLVLRGVGGIGKTTLAVEFAYRYGTFFADGVQWVRCEDEKSIPAEIASCGASGREVSRGTFGSEFEDLPLGNQVRLVQNEWNTPRSRLLIFDGCEDRQVLERWLPRQGSARLLVTSRSLDCPELPPLFEALTLALGPLEQAEGVALLRRCERKRSASNEALTALWSELEGHPLALRMAGAALQESTADQLLAELRQARTDIASADPGRSLEWSLTEGLKRLDSDGLAGALAHSLILRAAHFASSEPIPLSLLAGAVGKDEQDPALAEALDKLTCLGLVALADTGATIDPAVAPWLRERSTPEDSLAAEAAAYRELLQHHQAGESSRLISWQAHLRAVTDAAKDRSDLSAARLCTAFGRHLSDIGDRDDAVAYLERAAAIWELQADSGEERAEVLEELGTLLRQGERGELAQARAVYEKAVQVRQRSASAEADSLALARVLSDLGLVVQSQGDRLAARHYFEESLAMWERLLGPDAPDTHAARTQLQFLLEEQGVAEREFIETIPWGKFLLGRMRADRAIITQIRGAGPSLWLCRCRLPEHLQEAYGIAPEVLFLVAHSEVKGQDLLTALEELQRRDLDLDPDLLVIVDDRPRLKDRLDRLPLRWGQWVPWEHTATEFASLDELFRRHLPLYDVFEQRDPVRGRQVIGRNTIVADLRKRVQQGQSVGLFGLRKMGKTTVARAVTDWLDPLSAHGDLREQGKSAVLAVWLDSERLVEPSVDTLIKYLGNELRKRLALENPVPLPEGDPTDLGAFLYAALERTNLPICVVVDEYDLLFERGDRQPGIGGIEKLFLVLRAAAQETRRVTLMVIGRTPTFLESPTMNGWPNPMLNWVVPSWLGPLPSDGADELLIKLGRRVLLEVGPETACLARHWTGGHPLLHRQFGSALLEKGRANRMVTPEPVATDVFCHDALNLFLARDAVTTICREVSHFLATSYPDAAALLEYLCCQGPEEAMRRVKDRDGWLRVEARLLRNFGLLSEDSGTLTVPEVFRWYLRTLMPQVQNRTA
jgi:tetratricopeptide (TPR) repeat protein